MALFLAKRGINDNNNQEIKKKIAIQKLNGASQSHGRLQLFFMSEQECKKEQISTPLLSKHGSGMAQWKENNLAVCLMCLFSFSASWCGESGRWMSMYRWYVGRDTSRLFIPPPPKRGPFFPRCKHANNHDMLSDGPLSISHHASAIRWRGGIFFLFFFFRER